MSGSKYHKQFDPEYKKEMVRLVEELGRSPVDVAKDIGVTATSVRRWVKQYGSQGQASFPGKGNLHPADEEARKWFKRPLTKKEQEDRDLAGKIKQLFFDSRRTYGHRRLKKKLRKNGIKCSNDRVRRLMKSMHLVPVQARRFKATTNSNHSLPVAPNLLNKNFESNEPCQK